MKNVDCVVMGSSLGRTCVRGRLVYHNQGEHSFGFRAERPFGVKEDIESNKCAERTCGLRIV